MKPRTLIGILATALGTVVARGDYSFTVNSLIPDGNPVGVTSVGSVSGLPTGGLVSGLTVGLNVSGGYNGDLQAYLQSPNGITVTLFSQPGVTGSDPFGYGGSGMNITLSDAAPGGINDTFETPGALLTGTYRPIVSLSIFDGRSANGEWTLFVADLSQGGGQAVLQNWSLNLTTTAAVPEPDQIAAMTLLGLTVLVAFTVRRWLRKLSYGGLQRPAGHVCPLHPADGPMF